jgi:hypothetical protein
VAAATTQVGGSASGQQFSIWNWPQGFLSTCAPRCLHTGLLGQVRVVITLAGTEVLMKHTAAAPTDPAGYSLTDIYATVDTVSVSDDVYMPLLQERLSSPDNPISIPYSRWVSFSPGIVSTLQQTTTGTISTESLDFLVGTYQVTPLTNAPIADVRASDWFDTGSSDLVSSSFSINNVNFPSFSCAPHDALTQTLMALNVAQDSVGAADPNMNTFAKWRDSFFAHFMRLSHPTASDERVRSGLNLRGTQTTIAYTTSGTVANVIPHLFAGCTSILQVKAFKQLEVIW